MTHYWIALRKRSGSKPAQCKTRVRSLLAPDRETAKRTAERRWPGHRVVFIEPLPEMLPARILDIQSALRRGGYYIDTNALSERFSCKVAYDRAVESCQRLGEDHRHTLAQLESLQVVNACHRVGEFVRALEDVYNDVSWHFAREEMPGGVYRSIAALGGYGETLRKLHRDHLGILTALECMIAQLVAPMDQPLEERVHNAVPATAALIQHCQQHEYQERLLTESLLHR